MKRFLGILAALSLVMVLASVVLAVTVLRPRTEILRPTLTEWPRKDAPIRLRYQVTRRWTLYPLSQWRFDKHGCRGVSGWQYGPFDFQEAHGRTIWPEAMERVAHAMAVQKLGVKEPVLDIQRNSRKALSWHVVASAPTGKRLEMDFGLIFDHHSNPLLTYRIPQTTKMMVLPAR